MEAKAVKSFVSLWRPQFAEKPAQRIRIDRVNRHYDLFRAIAFGALECTQGQIGSRRHDAAKRHFRLTVGAMWLSD
jgi:hypothetical protein